MIEVFKTDVNEKDHARMLVDRIHKAFRIVVLILIWRIATDPSGKGYHRRRRNMANC